MQLLFHLRARRCAPPRPCRARLSSRQARAPSSRATRLSARSRRSRRTFSFSTSFGRIAISCSMPCNSTRGSASFVVLTRSMYGCVGVRPCVSAQRKVASAPSSATGLLRGRDEGFALAPTRAAGFASPPRFHRRVLQRAAGLAREAHAAAFEKFRAAALDRLRSPRDSRDTPAVPRAPRVPSSRADAAGGWRSRAWRRRRAPRACRFASVRRDGKPRALVRASPAAVRVRFSRAVAVSGFHAESAFSPHAISNASPCATTSSSGSASRLAKV